MGSCAVALVLDVRFAAYAAAEPAVLVDWRGARCAHPTHGSCGRVVHGVIFPAAPQGGVSDTNLHSWQPTVMLPDGQRRRCPLKASECKATLRRLGPCRFASCFRCCRCSMWRQLQALRAPGSCAGHGAAREFFGTSARASGRWRACALCSRLLRPHTTTTQAVQHYCSCMPTVPQGSAT